MSELRMYLNGSTVQLNPHASISYNILQHCEWLGQGIPKFCYHEQLSIAGNCRMCLVESGTSAKPVLACATEVAPESEIYTNSALVKQAREQMLEFLLLNHPLDCPICDQGGECDLQDITYVYGSDRSRYTSEKRGVSPFYFGPLVKVVMTRCIQCTRCVRFLDEIVGLASIGSTGRGTNNTITTYSHASTVLFAYSSQVRMLNKQHAMILGNVADICPVGALTVRPSSYLLRVWDVSSTESLDVLDSLCSNIRVDTNGSGIVRILPRLNSWINHEMITDKIRFSATGLSNYRTTMPLIQSCYHAVHHSGEQGVSRASEYGCSLSPVSWDLAYEYVAYCLSSLLVNSADSYTHFFDAYAGGLIDSFTMFATLIACRVLGISSLNRNRCADVDLRSMFILAETQNSVLSSSNILFMFGTNVRKESPILNIRVTSRLKDTMHAYAVCYVGTSMCSRHKLRHIGHSSTAMRLLCNGNYASSTACARDLQLSSCFVGGVVGKHVQQTKMLCNLFRQVLQLSMLVGALHIYEHSAMACYNVRSTWI